MILFYRITTDLTPLGEHFLVEKYHHGYWRKLDLQYSLEDAKVSLKEFIEKYKKEKLYDIKKSNYVSKTYTPTELGIK